MFVDKGGDADTFKALSVVHSILSDEDKRKTYDDTGDIYGDDMLSGDFDQWYDYFRNLFPKVTVADIDKFSSTYKGSEEEKTDIIEAYYQHSGNFRDIMETVILAEAEDEDRIIGILNKAIGDGEVEILPGYQKIYSGRDGKGSAKPAAKKRKKKASSSNKEDDLDSLANMIRSKNQRAAEGHGAFSSIFAKYGGEDLEEGDIGQDPLGDEEFERIRASLGDGSKSKKRGKKR